MKDHKQFATQQRMTPQRSVILEELRRLKNHPTADELFMVVRRRLPRVSLGTIYRNLDVLVKNGQIRKLEGHGTQARYDGENDQHQHIQCEGCGRIDDLDLHAPETPDLSETGYNQVRCQVIFTGICPDCQAAQSRN